MAGQHLAVVTDRLLSPRARLWVYGVAIAAIAVLVGYGIIDAGHSGLWVTLATAVLGIGGSSLAAANVPGLTVQAVPVPPAVPSPGPGAPSLQAGPGTVAQSDTAPPADATPAG